MYSAGLRRVEVVAIGLADYNPEQRQLVIRSKGRKERIAHLIEGTTAALSDWLDARGAVPGPLFWPVNKGGRR